jgi:hypothetical protein
MNKLLLKINFFLCLISQNINIIRYTNYYIKICQYTTLCTNYYRKRKCQNNNSFIYTKIVNKFGKHTFFIKNFNFLCFIIKLHITMTYYNGTLHVNIYVFI